MLINRCLTLTAITERVVKRRAVGKLIFRNGKTNIAMAEILSQNNGLFGVDPTCFNVCHGLTWIGVDKNNPNYKSSDGVLYGRERTMIIRCPPRKNYSNINQ